MAQSSEQAIELIEYMLRQIEVFEDSGGRSSNTKPKLNTRASVSGMTESKIVLDGSAQARRRQQIVGDNSLGNEVKQTIVEMVEKSEETQLMIRYILKEHFLFRSLRDSDLEDVIGQMKEERFTEGEQIIIQGEMGDKFYIMEEGKCSIIIDGKVVGKYGRGDSFGELALIYFAPRAATIEATAECTLWTLERAFFFEAKKTTNCNTNAVLSTFLSKLKLFGSDIGFFSDLSPDKLTQLCNALTLKEFNSGDIIIKQGEIGEDMFILYSGTVMVTETVEGSNEPIPRMALGQYTVREFCDSEGNTLSRDKTGNGQWQGSIFGERSLIKKEPRARNIVAKTTTAAWKEIYVTPPKGTGKKIVKVNGVEYELSDVIKPPEEPLNPASPFFLGFEEPISKVQVLSLGVKDFQALLGHKVKEMADMNDFRILQGIPTFKQCNLKNSRLKKLQNLLRRNKCWLNKRIETNSADLFIILDGCFESPDGTQYRLGEMLGNLQETADSITPSLTCCTEEEKMPCIAQLSRQVLLDCINNPDIEEDSAPSSAGNDDVDEEERGRRELAETAKRRMASVQRRKDALVVTNVRLEDLEVLRGLGKGTFGSVYLGRHKPTGRLMALKCIDKATIANNGHECIIVREAQTLYNFYHPFIADYYGIIVSPRKAMFMLDYIPGGELLSYLYSDQAAGDHGGLPVSEATLYVACIAMALEHVHSLGYAYRDLKPENLLIDGSGYIKLVDFGLAKEIPFINVDEEDGRKSIMYRTNTVCGTPEFMAPEVIRLDGYDKSADFWALGILLYEMLCGTTPFESGGNAKATFEKICRTNLQIDFPVHFHAHCKVFIRRLLFPNPALRLGNMQNGFQDIYSHDVFSTQAVDFEALLRKEVPMNFIPTHVSLPAQQMLSDEFEFFDCEREALTTEDDIYVDLFRDLILQ